jgi:hypothetical protein
MAGRSRARRWVAAALVFGLAAAATGCGLSAEDSPREIGDDEVGFDLLSPTTAPPTTLGDEIPTSQALLYFADTEGEVVRPVAREIPEPQNVSTLLRALFDARPTPGDTNRGLTNVITPQTRLLEVSDPSPCLVVIDLASYFPGLSAEEVSYAIAQIVYTLDDFVGRGVEVSIRVEGLPEDVRTADGRSVSALTREDLPEFDERFPRRSTGATALAAESAETSTSTTRASEPCGTTPAAARAE